MAQTISVIISLIASRRKETGIHLTKKELRVKRDVLGQILKIGIPVAVQDGCIQVAFIVISVIANHRGLNDAADRYDLYRAILHAGNGACIICTEYRCRKA